MKLLKSQPKTTPTKPVEYPAGVFVQTEKGYFYIVEPGKRYWIISKRVLDSWSPQRVIQTSEAAVAKFRIAARMKFRGGSLIHNLKDGKIYLIVGGLRYQMTSPDAFDRIGAKVSEAVTVSPDEINLHDFGGEIA
jgi:hypothetical protein